MKGINKEEFEEIFKEHLKENKVKIAAPVDHFKLTQDLYSGGASINIKKER